MSSGTEPVEARTRTMTQGSQAKTMQETVADWLNTAPVPKAVKAQVAGLVRSGLVDLGQLVVAIEACAYAGKPERVVPFLSAVQFLNTQDVSVGDALRMAKEANRRIDIAWSPARWKEEHSKLGRREALMKIVSERCGFDVSSFESLLPASFKGYLIRDSRRLGMEGYRQRHCVASYANRCARGEIAIAAVFHEGKRYTAELAHWRNGGEPTGELRLVQLKGRFNRDAPAVVQAAIHQMLGTVDKSARGGSPGEGLGPEREPLDERVRRALVAMRQHGIAGAEVSFDGSGDSGQIEYVRAWFRDAHGQRSSADALLDLVRVIDVVAENVCGAGGRFERRSVERQVSLRDFLEGIGDEWSETCDGNWCDNDGGFGSVEFDAVKGTVTAEVNVRTSDSELADGDEWEFDDLPAMAGVGEPAADDAAAVREADVADDVTGEAHPADEEASAADAGTAVDDESPTPPPIVLRLLRRASQSGDLAA